MFSHIKKFAIYLTVGVLPLFWLPWSVEAFEFNKGYLLFGLVAIGILAWVGEMIFQNKELRFRRTPLDIYVLGFLVVMLLSCVFSVDKISSLLGFYGRFWPSVMGILSLAGFYFLVTNTVGARNQTRNGRDKSQNGRDESRPYGTVGMSGLIRVFLISVAVVVVTALMSVFGMWGRLAGLAGIQLPRVMTGSGFNMAGGSMQGLAMWLAVIAVLMVGLLAFRDRGGEGRLGAVAQYTLLALIVALLALIDFWPAWVVLAVTMAVFLAVALFKRIFGPHVNRLSIAILILLLAVVFLVINPIQQIMEQVHLRSPAASFGVTKEILPSQTVSWKTALGGLRERPVLGSGPSTFSYVFSKHKPPSFSKTNLWQIRFNRPASHMAEVVATRGALGILSWLALVGIFCMVSWLVISNAAAGGQRGKPASNSNVKSRTSRYISMPLATLLPLFLAVIAVVIAQLVYYQNTVLAFSFWLFLGLAVVAWQKPVKEKTYTFGDFPEIGLLFSVAFWVLLLGFLLTGFYLAKFYWADMYYRAYLENPRGSQALQKMEQAANMAPQRTVYNLAFSRALLVKLNREAVKSEPDQAVVTNLAATAVEQARRTADQAPNRVAAQEVAGMVYRDLRGIADGALEWGQKKFAAALKLEPGNPVLMTELGKLCVGAETATGTEPVGTPACRQAGTSVRPSRALFQRALDLRPSYGDAAVQLALLQESGDNIAKAIATLERAVPQNLRAIEPAFQLGRLLYNDGQYNRAARLFQRVLSVFPNHSNSMYSLGLVYQKQGKKEKALQQFEKVLKLNPDNKDVKSKIQALKRGSAEQQETIEPEE